MFMSFMVRCRPHARRAFKCVVVRAWFRRHMCDGCAQRSDNVSDLTVRDRALMVEHHDELVARDFMGAPCQRRGPVCTHRRAFFGTHTTGAGRLRSPWWWRSCGRGALFVHLFFELRVALTEYVPSLTLVSHKTPLRRSSPHLGPVEVPGHGLECCVVAHQETWSAQARQDRPGPVGRGPNQPLPDVAPFWCAPKHRNAAGPEAVGSCNTRVTKR